MNLDSVSQEFSADAGGFSEAVSKQHAGGAREKQQQQNQNGEERLAAFPQLEQVHLLAE